MTTMLYKSPGQFKRSTDETFDLCIVTDEELEAAIKDGWHYTVGDALTAAGGTSHHSDPEAEAKPKRGRGRKSEAL